MKKILRVTVIVTGSLVALYILALPFQADPADPVWFFESQPVSIIAHRGASGHMPENTILSFDAALEMGAHVLEMDLQRTADNQIVVLHDATVDRTTNGTGPVGELTLQEVQALDAAYRWEDERGNTPFRGRGIRIPTLEEILSRYPGIPLLIELKTDSDIGIAERVSELIDEYQAQDRVMVASFDSAYLDAFRELQPEVPTSLGVQETRSLYVLHFLGLHRWYTPAGDSLQVPQRFSGLPVLLPTFRRAARQRGLDLQVWTINSSDTMLELLEKGVDGIITDYPDRAVEAVEAAGIVETDG
ncbi:MAG: glycerophosphodiester phosphodiesterase [Spirochaetaceae bacterium]